MIFIFAIITQSFAFTLFGPYSNLTGFNVDDLYIYANTTNCPQGFTSTLQNSINVWNDVPMSRLQLHFAGSSSATASDLRVGNFEERVVVACSIQFELDSQNQSGNNGCTSSCLDRVYARAGVFADSQQRLLKSYVVLNLNPSAQANFSHLSPERQQVVLAHELGHTLGLGHSEESQALMYAFVSNKSSVSLDYDDQQGLAFLYPYDTPLGCGNTRQSKPWFIVFILLPVFIIKRFKTKKRVRYQKFLQKSF